MMFNGIIKNTGVINRIAKKNNNCFLELSSKLRFNKDEIGSSIACSGACLTLEKYKIDPALATGPFITTVNDILGLYIYFLIGQAIL